MTSRKAAKSSGSSQSFWRYFVASLGVLGGAGGRLGHRRKTFAVVVFRHSAMCKGVFGRPQEHFRVALSWWNFRWYYAKSPWLVRIASSLARVGRVSSSSWGGRVGWYGSFHWVYQLESLLLALFHQAALAVASCAFLIVRIPDTVGCAASPYGVEGSFASASARLSAASLPSMLVCPGAHRILTLGIESIISWH